MTLVYMRSRQIIHLASIFLGLAMATTPNIYPIMDVCNTSLWLDEKLFHIGIIRVNNTNKYYYNTFGPSCIVRLEDRHSNFKIGVQLLQLQGPHQKLCPLEVYPNPQIQDGPVNCLWNTSLINTEVTSVNHKLDIVFQFDAADSDKSDVNAAQDDVTLDVMFYSFTLTNNQGECESADTDICERTSRCIRLSVLEYAKLYNLCQTNSETVDASKEEDETSYFGVAVFAGTLVFLLVILVALQICHSKSFCHSLKVFFCLVDEEEENARNRDGRPQFTLDEPPPSYSDLSSIDSYQNNGTDTVTDAPNPQVDARNPGSEPTTQGTSAYLDPYVNRHIGVIPVASTATLPPSYSDVVIHQDKYDVHQ